MSKVNSIYTQRLGRTVAKHAKGTVGKYHVIPIHGLWNVVEEGRVEPLRRFSTKEAAVTFAKRFASAANFGEVVVHGIDGKIVDRISY